MKKKNKWLIIIGIIVGIIILMLLAGILIYNIMLLPIDKKSDETINLEIELGTSTSKLAEILKENNLIRSKNIFKLYVKLNGKSNFKAGTYELKKSMSIKEITEYLQTGVLYSKNQISLTYIEGKNMRYLASKIAEVTNNTEEDVYNLLVDKDYLNSIISEYWFITDDIKQEEIYYSLEGYLFPDTYNLESKDVTVKQIFKKMLDKMENVLDEYRAEIENGKYSIHEILTVASIIETESINSDDRKNVASVIYNRLNAGMAIQSDVTTYYAIKVDVGTRDLYQKELDTYNPYNTRGPNMQGKLPIGPVSSVSKTSIEAAIEPNNTDYLYFVADKNGKVYFTKTNSEHEQIINKLENEGLWYEY